VAYIKDCFGLSGRRASRLVDLSRNTLRHKQKPDKDEALRTRMKELATRRKRYGCRRLLKYLKREGLVINKKRTERIYREENSKYAYAEERSWQLRLG